jgi:hypothetical protein
MFKISILNVGAPLVIRGISVRNTNIYKIKHKK